MQQLIITTPIGNIMLEGNEHSLCGVNLTSAPISDYNAAPVVLQETAKQLLEYFQGKRTYFTINLNYNGTPFQRLVWEELLKIPFGETIRYASLAQKIGNPKAARAIGNACNRNPLPFLIPCHRVVPSTGMTGGYRFGADLKIKLLKLEQTGQL